MIRTAILRLFFVLPLLFTGSILLWSYFLFFEKEPPATLQYPLMISFLTGLGAAVLLYLFIIVSVISAQIKKLHHLHVIVRSIYTKHMALIVFSTSATLSFIVMILFSLFVHIDIPLPYKLWQEIILLFALFLTGILFMLAYFFPYKKLGSIVLAFVLLVVVGYVGYIVYGFYQELRPQQFLTFPLDDPKGVYIINYDGDYWVTYYTKQKVCKQQCFMDFVKTGNTSIVSSPVPLEQFRDKHVRIQGDFVWTGSPLWQKRLLCIGEEGKQACNPSMGPGSWSASPLIIQTITHDIK